MADRQLSVRTSSSTNQEPRALLFSIELLRVSPEVSREERETGFGTEYIRIRWGSKRFEIEFLNLEENSVSVLECLESKTDRIRFENESNSVREIIEFGSK